MSSVYRNTIITYRKTGFYKFLVVNVACNYILNGLPPTIFPCVILYLPKTHTLFSFGGLKDFVEGKHNGKNFQRKESRENYLPLFLFYLLSLSITHLRSFKQSRCASDCLFDDPLTSIIRLFL